MSNYIKTILDFIFVLSYLVVKRNELESRGWMSVKMIGFFIVCVFVSSIPLISSISVCHEETLDMLLVVLGVIFVYVFLFRYYNEKRQTRIINMKISSLSEKKKKYYETLGYIILIFSFVSMLLSLIFLCNK